MMLHEVVKLGLPFKRGVDNNWLKIINGGPIRYAQDGGCTLYILTAADIIAEDWEVYEKKRSITKQQLLDILESHEGGAYVASTKIDKYWNTLNEDNK